MQRWAQHFHLQETACVELGDDDCQLLNAQAACKLRMLARLAAAWLKTGLKAALRSIH